MATMGAGSIRLFTAGLAAMTSVPFQPGDLIAELAWSGLALLALTSVISLEAGAA